MIGWDFNSRVSDLQDFIIEKQKELQCLPSCYEVDPIVSRLCSEDVTSYNNIL